MGERLSDHLRQPGLDTVELLKPVSMSPELVNGPNVLSPQHFPGRYGQIETSNGSCAGTIKMGHGKLLSRTGGNARISQPSVPGSVPANDKPLYALTEGSTTTVPETPFLRNLAAMLGCSCRAAPERCLREAGATEVDRGCAPMNPLLKEIRHNPLLWLLAFVPVVFIAQNIKPDAHTLLFVLSVLAIVPLAGLLSHATESVAAKTGDTVGGLLNATLGNLTELVIALTALHAGQYTLVKASIAGAIVTNTLFMLGMSFLLGGLRHHVQEYDKASARLQAGLLFLATIAILIPSALSGADSAAESAFTEKLSIGLSVLLIAAYGLGLLFSLRTHRELFGGTGHAEAAEAPWPMGLALATLAGVTVLVALVSEIFVESVQHAALTFGMSSAFV